MSESYPEKWRDHRFLVFLKVGICQKSGEVDFLRNVSASEALCEADRLDAAKLLRLLADDFENGWELEELTK